MTKAVVLHIGTHKTGTTSIQQWLAHAQVDGSLRPFCYPLWKQLPHHNRLVMLYYPHDKLVGTLRQRYPVDDRRFRDDREDLRRVFFGGLRAASGAVVSGEILCGFGAPQVAQLRADLESAGYREFHIVVYIRDPADFYLSRTQQALKATGSDPSWFLSRIRQGDDVLTSSANDPVMNPRTFLYDFRRAVDTWESEFPGRLIVRRFPRTPDYDAVSDFAGVLEERIGASLPRAPVRMNAALSAEAMQILQDYRSTFWPNSNVLTPDTIRLVELLKTSVTDVPQTKPVLRQEIAEHIRANHLTDAEYVQSRYGVELDVGNATPGNVAVPRGKPYQIDEIVEHVDRDVVTTLLLRVANSELTRTSKVFGGGGTWL